MQEKDAVHVAIIMDGNGRWAKKRGLPRTGGHKVGAEVLRTMVEFAVKTPIQYLTCYAFSTENWKRPKLEVQFLMTLLSLYLDQEVANLQKNGVALKIIGDKSGLSSKLQKQIEKAEKATESGRNLQLNLAINYGGRQDLTQAVRQIARQVQSGEREIQDINETVIFEALSTAGIPEPDLLIRPGGDCRISNFLLWEMAYTEFFFISKLWPDFTEEDFQRILEEFKSRERRFGGLTETGGSDASS